MYCVNLLRRAGLGALLLLCGIGVATAQQPSFTTATYGDWVVRCRAVEAVAPATPTQACEMATVVNAQAPGGAARPIAQVAVGYAPTPAGAPAMATMVLQVPEGVSLRDEIALVLGAAEAESGRVVAAYFRCMQSFCLAEASLDQAVLDKIGAAAGARISFVDGAQRPVELPISLNGFAPAATAALGLPPA